MCRHTQGALVLWMVGDGLRCTRLLITPRSLSCKWGPLRIAAGAGGWQAGGAHGSNAHVWLRLRDVGGEAGVKAAIIISHSTCFTAGSSQQPRCLPLLNPSARLCTSGRNVVAAIALTEWVGPRVPP
jgi:hypothetical protein